MEKDLKRRELGILRYAAFIAYPVHSHTCLLQICEAKSLMQEKPTLSNKYQQSSEGHINTNRTSGVSSSVLSCNLANSFQILGMRLSSKASCSPGAVGCDAEGCEGVQSSGACNLGAGGARPLPACCQGAESHGRDHQAPHHLGRGGQHVQIPARPQPRHPPPPPFPSLAVKDPS